MNWRKVNLYILCSFAFSWTIALVMWLLHLDMSNSLGKVIIAAFYMPGPAIATFVIQKFIYKQGFSQYGWTFNKKAAKWILFTPLLFLALTVLAFAIAALLGNTHLVPEFGQVDFSQQDLSLRLKEMAGSAIDVNRIHIPSIPPFFLFVVMLVIGIVAGSTVNLPVMFGEEFGWRGLLLRETRSLGFLRANVFIGFIWGLWHWPVILMGLNYPHHPFLGILMMIVFTISLSPMFAYVRIKTQSILGSCMLHGMINATAAMYAFFIADGNEFYSSIAGWAGIIAAVILALCIALFDKKFVAEYTTAE